MMIIRPDPSSWDPGSARRRDRTRKCFDEAAEFQYRWWWWWLLGGWRRFDDHAHHAEKDRDEADHHPDWQEGFVHVDLQGHILPTLQRQLLTPLLSEWPPLFCQSVRATRYLVYEVVVLPVCGLIGGNAKKVNPLVRPILQSGHSHQFQTWKETQSYFLSGSSSTSLSWNQYRTSDTPTDLPAG